MDQPAVVVVGHHDDEHSDQLATVLARAGNVTIWRVARDQLPATTMAWRPQAGAELAGYRMRSHHVAGFWRRPGWPSVDDYADSYQDFVADECTDAFDGMLTALNIRWISSPAVLRRAELKLVQLQAATEAGIDIPATLVTNSQERAQTFSQGLRGVVVKPVRYGLLRTDHPPTVAYTTEVTGEQLQPLEGPPVIIQERIAARLHLRVVTVGDATYVASLEADETDWRSALQNHELFRTVSGVLRDEVGRQAQLLAAALDIGYSAQDWIVSTDDRLVFLEANPNGQWLFLDPLWEGAITETIARRLEMLAKH